MTPPWDASALLKVTNGASGQVSMLQDARLHLFGQIKFLLYDLSCKNWVLFLTGHCVLYIEFKFRYLKIKKKKCFPLE